MFFRSKCPLSTHEKTWAEFRLQWFAHNTGIDRLTTADVVLPNEHFFPGTFGGTQASGGTQGNGGIQDNVDEYGRIIARHLSVRDIPRFEIGEADLVGVPARFVPDQSTLLIADSELRDPIHLVSAMTRELSRCQLLSDEHVTGDEPDFESLVDLYSIFCGMGVFCANGTAQDLPADAVPRRSCLSSRVVGYSLALFAWARGDIEPAWSEYLRHDASDVMKRGLKFLAKMQDSVFEPTAGRDRQRWSVGQSLENLSAKSASHRLAALWYLKGHGDFSEAVSVAIQGCLRDSDVAVRRAATALTSKLTAANANLQDDLLDAIRDGDAEVRACAALAIGEHGFMGPDVELGLEPLLNDPNRDVLLNTATTMATIGINDAATVERLGKRFKTALVDCNYDFAHRLAEPIGKMHGDIHEFAKSFFAHDPELLAQAQIVLDEMSEPRPT